MWPEVEKAKKENRHEIVLSGKEITTRIKKDGLDIELFTLEGLNYLNISETVLSEIPDKIKVLTNLQTLVLHSNNLEHVNEAISNLDKLKVLDLSRNKIKEIPDIFLNLLQIVTLNLNGNCLETFPTLAKNTKLAMLDLSNNSLKSFPNICCSELANLSEVKLNGNDIEEIPNTINKLPMLKLLDISSNKIKSVPGELADCGKLKEVNLKSNPISDRRLLKLIDQCRTKQIIDYVKQHCQKTSTNDGDLKGGNRKKKQSEDSNEGENKQSYKYSINVKYADEKLKVILTENVKNVREHLVACIVNKVAFNEETFKKFIQVQNKLHDTLCEKRNNATIATHDLNKLPPGDLTYTTVLPNDLMIKPLNRTNIMTGAELFSKLQIEANNLRKEKKRNTYSGIHKFLYLIEGKAQYPCLMNSNKEVISFPPITNSDISKIDVNTTRLLIEVTSSVSQYVCKNVMDTILKEMVSLFESDMEVQQVKSTDIEGHLKIVYPNKTDLNFDKTVPIKVNRD